MKIISIFYIICFVQVSVLGQAIKYNKLYTVACHNCYMLKADRKIVDVFKFTSTIEIDIWDNSLFSGKIANVAKSTKMGGDWFVKHLPTENGNVNCCGGTLSDCLKTINSWSNRHPNHPVITIFLDKKENWSDGNETRNPFDLDQLIISIFSNKKIYRPFNLLSGKPDLKAAALTNWPVLESLKGKFIFVITDASTQVDIPYISKRRTLLDEYLIERSTNGVCFVAPEISKSSEILNPNGFSLNNVKNVVFYNLYYEYKSLASKIGALGCLTRVFGAPETPEDIKDLINEKINFIALDNYQR